MGILFVLIFYLIVMTGLAAIGSLLFSTAANRLIRSFKDRAGKIVLIATLFPFACEVFAGVWFVAYAVTNAEVFHRDPGLGDSWETPLPNGYAF
jgi:succinate dehydrogenase/fumarate reductase cytochrome b subunit